jgi:hypothetical protein
VNKLVANTAYYLAFLLAAATFVLVAYLLWFWLRGDLPGPWISAFIWLGSMYIGAIYPLHRKQAVSRRDEA